jgi:hypothetical protein
MTDTIPPKRQPFEGLFKKHPWLIPILMMLRRMTGIIREFLDVYVAPFAKK